MSGDLLIVCLGNICRSPIVAEVIRRRFAAAGQPRVIDSCGTGGWHAGKGADARMRQAASAAGYDLSTHRARQLRDSDFAAFRQILAMDHDNLRELRQRCPPALRDRLGLFLDVAGVQGVDEVPDPYYGDADDFAHVIALAEQGAEGLLKHAPQDQVESGTLRASLSR